MIIKASLIATLASLAVVSTEVLAADASILGSGLTANGADPSASADGMIPAYTGGITKPPADYVAGGDHVDPFAADKPLFSITAQNMGEYSNRLSAGQKALLARKEGNYRMDIYPSRRSCALPQFVYDETKKNVARARLIDGGNGVAGARIGVPFPITKNALEIFWNHNFYWHGHRYHAITSGANVYKNGAITKIIREDWRYNFYADPQGPDPQHANDQFHWMGIWKAPQRFNGSGFSMTNTINQVKEPRNGVMFNPSTRRIMKAPAAAVTYEGPLSTADGMRQSHDMFLFSGSPDRYEWKLLGKKEIFVPYNAYKASASTTSHDALMTPHNLNPDYLRYELHRVWVLEATQKDNFRMKQARRVFYVDEDSWIFLMADIFNKRDELIYVQHAFTKNYYEAPACVFEFDVMHDMTTGNYNVDHIKLDHGPADLNFDLELSDFGSAALRRKIGR
ncbi:MAG: outer membrane lipoprotein-sorting protein [Rhodobiaceae bacterium]|nr:outer membrane lipoprotein-sorting protein [Rhodobiaceae bacterium]